MLREKMSNIYAIALAFCLAAMLTAMHAPTAIAQTSAQAQPRARRTQPTPTASGQSDDARQRDSQPSPTDAQPDLSITARVTARELRFEKVPNPKVEFTGQPGRETVWTAERENLPDEVQPGVTYRNIGITLRITSVFADIDRIVAEALGEVPASGGTQSQGATPESPATPPATAQAIDAPPPTAENSAPQVDAQLTSPANSSPAKATAMTRSTRPARKGRKN